MSQDDQQPQALLEVEALTAGYGGLPIVKNVSMHVSEGDFACIVGPNGSGKSTLLKSLMGITDVLSGTVSLAGSGDITGLSVYHRVQVGIGYVPQVKDVFPPLTVEENLDLGGYLLKRRQLGERKQAVLDMFPRLKDKVNQLSGTLSGGERKMLAMARVLILEPRLLLLDEPTAGLTEAAGHRLVSEQLAALVEAGIAVVLVEQRANLALAAAHRAYVLGSGEVRREGPTDQLLADPSFAEVFLGKYANRPEGQEPTTLQTTKTGGAE